ncbi:hypothetical protein [Gulosibacter sp. 10]|uniref:hypothetical protein n=1 Tax=Gulosibacter sp. 10 TaxID=1255570 RepID=UPI00097EBA74|nr:hypothetical protein [Gulosibacter sp. 10]SJM64477.1 hypothetical protein FM112_10230 [Gulosibacter sp. 10]
MAEGGEAEFTLLHRMHFWARRSKDPAFRGMNTWEYRGDAWRVRRPADGDPPVEVELRCSQCSEVLALRVESAQTMRRRKRILRSIALVVVLICVLSAVSCTSFMVRAEDSGIGDAEQARATTWAIISLVVAFVSVGTASALLAANDNQIGVVGSGIANPFKSKHIVRLARRDAPAGGSGSPGRLGNPGASRNPGGSGPRPRGR